MASLSSFAFSPQRIIFFCYNLNASSSSMYVFSLLSSIGTSTGDSWVFGGGISLNAFGVDGNAEVGAWSLSTSTRLCGMFHVRGLPNTFLHEYKER